LEQPGRPHIRHRFAAALIAAPGGLAVNSVIYLVGLIVVVLAVLSFVGIR
jgi:hypothetical protein